MQHICSLKYLGLLTLRVVTVVSIPLLTTVLILLIKNNLQNHGVQRNFPASTVSIMWAYTGLFCQEI